MSKVRGFIPILVFVCALLLVASTAYAQETTGGLQGTVKDPSGAVVPSTKVVVTSSSLAGAKELTTDSSGYYRFANLAPGTYTITVTAPGFKTYKREGLILEVGHLPTVDVALELGSAAQTVEVSAAAPVIDTSTTQNLTNVTTDVINNIPHGLSYQSAIQFAPMARNEPLGGMAINGQGGGGTGGSSPGSSGNGLTFGYSVGGASDAENSYLVEGQDTGQNAGGYSKANVPYQFIQEVEIKTSGVEAEYGGALGGVVNVVMKKGGNEFHGQLYSTYETSGADANNNSIFLRYDPTAVAPPVGDLASQEYNPKKDHYRILQPGFAIGGPIIKDKLYFFLGAAPQINSLAKTVNFGANDGGAGAQYFTQDKQSYFTNARLDYAATSRIRLYASWLYQYARETGAAMPISDPVNSESGYLNTSTGAPLTAFSHGLGWAAPNATYNFGGDINLTSRIVATTRFGYFFENYHDFGWQTSTPDIVWGNGGVGVNDNAAVPAGCIYGSKTNPCTGNPLPAGLQQPGGTATAPYTGTFTQVNANKHYQFNQDVAFFKGGWWGTHNIKVGYQLNHLTNVISQNGNVPQAFLNLGTGVAHATSTTVGVNNCATLTAEWGTCGGQYGNLVVQDFATVLTSPASDWNHAFFGQDNWTVGHGLTLTLGLRVEKEDLPAPPGVNVPAIHFSWSDKIAPRLGAAWDPTGHGKMKIFGSYGVVNDVMKLLVAQTSFGAQAFEQCSYALGPDATGGFSVSDLDLVFKNGRACPSGLPTAGANFASGSTPPSLIDAGTGVSLIENVNFRPAEPVAPGVKPFRQHEYVGGFDYQISPSIAFEARYDRRRLDHVIEDSSLADPIWGETYAIVNPGEGVNRTIDGYANYLQSLGQAFLVPGWQFNGPGANFGTCPTCPPLAKPVRNYDGVELRVTKVASKHWFGMFSYTYSRLWGNYTGLTTTDQTDGNAAGRNSPDTSRAFDEPFFYFGANGKSNNGLLPTDRPNTLKEQVYYTLPWKHMSTNFGIFTYQYQGTPMGSYVDLAAASYGIPYEATYIFGRGKYVNTAVDPNTGNITFGTPYARRTPWFMQTDLQVSHEFKVKERQALKFEANITNLFNQHSVVAYYTGLDSQYFETAMHPGGVNLSSGAALYQALMTGYNPQQFASGIVQSSQYGQPQQYQLLRNMYFGAYFTF
jgi:outer membrane receptor protein involved in Fe transport